MAPHSRHWLQYGLLLAALSGVAAIAGLGGAILWHQAAGPAALATGTLLAPARALPDFSLIDQRGGTFGPASLRGHWSMLFVGYTHCPEFCPATLSLLAALEKRLRADPAAVRPQIVFMSVDTDRDTPAQLALYVAAFDPEFIGVTAATQAAAEAVAAKLGVGVVMTRGADGTITVDHTGAIFVVDPDGRLAAILTGPFSVEALRTDFTRILADRA